MIGVTSAALCIMIIMTVGLTKQIFNRIRTKLEFNSFLQHVVPPMIGGIIIGFFIHFIYLLFFFAIICINFLINYIWKKGTVNWALPLTCGNGQDLLGVIIKNGANGSYNVPLLLRTGFARMLLLGVSLNSGFIGGLIFPMLTMASCAGTVMYQYYDYVPLGLCVGGFMIGIPCGICPMPFTFLLLICFIFYFGLYQTAPLFIVAITSYSIVCGSGFLKRLQDRQVEMSNAKATEEDNDLRAQKDLEKQEADQFAIKQYLGSRNFKVSVAENPINL
jgi:H+/Cl- antiporter ClcA